MIFSISCKKVSLPVNLHCLFQGSVQPYYFNFSISHCLYLFTHFIKSQNDILLLVTKNNNHLLYLTKVDKNLIFNIRFCIDQKYKCDILNFNVSIMYFIYPRKISLFKSFQNTFGHTS